MKLKVTNIFGAPYGVNSSQGVVTIIPGETWEGEFDDNEATHLSRQDKMWKVEGYKAPKPGDQKASLEDQVKSLTAERDDLAAKLALFDRDGNGAVGGSQGGAKLSLEDAVKGLDDKNDEHWTKAGVPQIEVLKSMTGNTELTRDEVAKVGRSRATS